MEVDGEHKDNFTTKFGEVGPGGHPVFITSATCFAKAFLDGWIVDGRSGGLVRGRLHEAGHISMISASSPLGTYEFVGLMEGGEYLMSEGATAAHLERVFEINQDQLPGGPDLPSLIEGRIIDVSAEPHDKLLVIGKQFIVSRNATCRHLDELVALNAPYAHRVGQFFDQETVEYLNAHPELGTSPTSEAEEEY